MQDSVKERPYLSDDLNRQLEGYIRLYRHLPVRRFHGRVFQMHDIQGRLVLKIASRLSAAFYGFSAVAL
jgi:hypothetical protein